jgi:GYF domain 2
MSFPITCTACHKTFTISDEIYEKKVAGRVVTIKCKSCSHGIRVDGSKGAASAPRGVAPAETAAPKQAEEPLWAVDYPDGQDREFTTGEVIAELERGAIGATTLIWREGMAEWLELAQVADFSEELGRLEADRLEAERMKAEVAARQAEATAVAAAAERAAEQAAAERTAAAAQAASQGGAAAKPVFHKPRAPIPTVSGLAGLGETPQPPPTQQTPEPPTPRAQLPSAPAIPPRAARGSTLEMPSPFAPHRPPAGPAAAAPAGPPATAAWPPSPFGTSGGHVELPPALPQAAAPPLPASLAQAASGSSGHKPSFPPPGAGMQPAAAPLALPAAAPLPVSAHASVEWPEARSKLPRVVFGVLLAGGLAALAFVLLTREDPPQLSSPVVAVSNGDDARSSATDPTRARTGSASAGEDAEASPRRGATPGAGFAELFAAGARKAESKGEKVAPSERFDPAAAKAPLAEAAAAVQACKQSGGPSGKVNVLVTFDPSGKVSNAAIGEAPFAGTPTAACIASALKRVEIPPFSGLPGSVTKTFSLL